MSWLSAKGVLVMAYVVIAQHLNRLFHSQKTCVKQQKNIFMPPTATGGLVVKAMNGC
jgi:uncharacterized membrane protein SirB2